MVTTFPDSPYLSRTCLDSPQGPSRQVSQWEPAAAKGLTSNLPQTYTFRVRLASNDPASYSV
jgi:hypothetical protein